MDARLPIDGRLHRRTPEGILLSCAPAGPAARMWAWALDVLFWGTGFCLAAALLARAGATGNGLVLLVGFCFWWGYPIVFEARGGRTPGKRILKLRVLRSDGLPIGWREAFLRGILQSADFLPIGFAAGLCCMLFVPGFRRVGDLAAGTVVVHDEAAPEPAQSAPRRGIPSPTPLLATEQRVLLDLLDRSERIPPERLDELGDAAEPLTGMRGRRSAERLLDIAAGLRS